LAAIVNAPPPRTPRNLITPLLSGMKRKGTYLVLMMVQSQVAVVKNIFHIKPTALNWDGTCLKVAEDMSSSMVAML
jgi:hypothetical protein